MRAPLEFRDLGRVPYARAWDVQRELVECRHRGGCGDVVLFCEHDPIVTTGRGTHEGFLVDERFDVVEVERGGEATYHGPGQVVAYPIVKLAEGRRDLHAYMRALEQACLDALAMIGLPGERREGATGVWIDFGRRKLASIGVAARRWVTWHGLALNLDPDLSHFEAIRPCGFGAEVMTSVRRELGDERTPTREVVVDELARALDRTLEPFREHEDVAHAGGDGLAYGEAR
ncbi:MAG: lipoyl(octanoyl) transferase LipB [Planctomycetes bacterium]|nr:lipoyl(octanoyl) transferase LipB [Planctomycetota bacterium]